MLTNESGNNYGLRDEIKGYWSQRAETFDLSPGHEIFSEDERTAWHALILKHLGEGKDRSALDLASGTGVVSHLMDDLGYVVTGLDWAEPMLERARAKAKTRGRSIHFRVGDAENTMEPDDAYDVIITRHLVWTLVDPVAAFREWMRVLKPGGKILIVDGDFVTAGFAERFLKAIASVCQKVGMVKSEPPTGAQNLSETHNSILSRVYFSGGARADAVSDLLRDVGFGNIYVDQNLRKIHKTQAKHLNFFKATSRGLQHRFAISCEKPKS